MSLFDLSEASRRPRGAKSLYDRARKYIGAVKGPLKPRNTAAKLARGIVAALADTGPIFALIRAGDADHERAMQFAWRFTGRAFTNHFPDRGSRNRALARSEPDSH